VRKKKKKEIGTTISLAYATIIRVVREFTDSAARKLKSKTTENMWEGRRLKRGI